MSHTITSEHIERALLRLNRATNSPIKPYDVPKTDAERLMYSGGLVPQSGNYHTDNDGPSIWLVRMGKNTSGTHSISPGGTKRELYNYIQAMLTGIDVGKELAKAEEANTIQFTRVNSDSNGNPRYVCGFLNLCTRDELDADGPASYANAVNRARKIDGRKFNNKQYGGGILFSTYSLDDTVKHINAVTGREFTGYTL